MRLVYALGPYWSVEGRLEGVLEPSWDVLGESGSTRGESWRLLGSLLTIFSRIFCHLEQCVKTMKNPGKPTVFHGFLRFWVSPGAQKIAEELIKLATASK